MKKKSDPKKPAPEAILLQQEEWDFSDCPSAQLRWCDLYEHSRENEKMLAAVEELRKTGKWRNEHQKLFPDAHCSSLAALLFNLFPEFPSTAFLAIDETRRAQRCAELDKERAARVVILLEQIHPAP